MRVKPKDGKLYEEVTLRDVLKQNDVSDLPMLSEMKRLYEENAKLRELVRDIADHVNHDDGFGIDRGWVLDRMRELGIEV